MPGEIRRWGAGLSGLVRRLAPLEFGAFGPPTVRREAVHLGLGRRVRLLYASDLHLGHWWTRDVPAQLVEVCREAAPDVILLGGDLVDHRAALGDLHDCVRALGGIAPVAAVPGNHDERAGVARLRRAVEAARGLWLPGRPLEQPVRIDAEVRPGGAAPRLLCAHYPDVFPAAARAGYRLVLAGHLHGGQCVLATRNGRLYPAVWLHRWHGLRFHDGAAALLVSRGLGDTFPFRFNCPREALLCEIS
jgi:predicted MPP superfamily phosphohydrolase